MSESLALLYFVAGFVAAVVAALVFVAPIRRQFARAESSESRLSSEKVTSESLALAKQTAEELLRFRGAMDMTDDGIFLIDRETMLFVDVNAAASRNMGYSREELLKMGPHDLLQADRAQLERDYDAIIAAGDAGVRTIRVAINKDGREMESEMHRRALHIGGRWIIVSLAHEITERRQAERAALRQTRMFAALSATNDAIMRVKFADELYRRVCDAAMTGGKLLTAAVCIPDSHSANVRVVAIAGMGEAQLREALISVDPAIPEGRGLIGEAFRARVPCVSNDLMNDDRSLPWRAQLQIGNVAAGAAVPLMRNEQVVGVLLFYSNEKRAFDDEIVNLLQHMARNIVFGLETLETEDERRRAEQQLRAT